MKQNHVRRASQIGGLILVLGLMPALRAEEPGSIAVTWGFDGPGNLAQPEVNQGLPGAQADLVVSGSGLGWTSAFPGLNNADGLCDLGGGGKITLRLGTAAGIRGPARLTVRVRQWLDGALFSEVVSVAVPGARPGGLAVGASGFGPVGGWVITQDSWEIPTGVTAYHATITSPPNGVVVDSVALALVVVPVEPLILSIGSVNGSNGQIQIAWPASAGPGVLESTLNPTDPESWLPSGLTADLSGDHYTVTTTADGAGRFFRLRK